MSTPQAGQGRISASPMPSFRAVALPDAAQAAGGRADIIARLGRRALEEVEGDTEFGEGRHGNT